jgi:two-component system response regulator YesN
VDDEFLVRMGLKSTVDWESNGFQLIGEAKNAKEAIELFQLYNPHIVLTDISMPGLTGLELIRKLKEYNPHLQSIILTHFEDFSYAQEAVGLGVVDYILKSNLNSERLLEVLKKARKRISGSVDIDSSFDSSELISLKDLLISLDLPKVERETLLLNYSSFFPYQFFLVFTFRINTNLSDQVFLDDIKKQALEKIISQSMFALSYTVKYCIEGNKIYFLVNFENSVEGGNLDKKILQHFQTLAGTIKKYLNLYILSGASSIGESLEGVKRLVYESNRSVEVAFFLNHHFAQFSEALDLPLQELKLDAISILHLMQSEEHSQVIKSVGNILENAKKSFDYTGLYEIFTQSLDIVRDYADWCLIERKENSIIASLLEYHNFYSLYDYEAVRTYLVNVFSQALTIKPEQANENPSEKYSYIIQRAIKYIGKNYYENISLSNVASHVEVSRSYLSFLFKHELGVNFSSFLAETRINQAKNLLSQTNMKIYEIAEDVGFDSPYYFSKVFKEVSGLTCKEFRNVNFKEA